MQEKPQRVVGLYIRYQGFYKKKRQLAAHRAVIVYFKGGLLEYKFKDKSMGKDKLKRYQVLYNVITMSNRRRAGEQKSEKTYFLAKKNQIHHRGKS